MKGIIKAWLLKIRGKSLLLLILSALLAISLSWLIPILWELPHLELWNYDFSNDKEYLDAVQNQRRLIITMLGGALAVAGIIAAYIRSVAMSKQAAVAQDVQRSESFTRAIDQLGHEKIEIRLGGIYSLHHIAKKTEEYQQTVVNILCAFIREDSQDKEGVQNDIQAALTLIGEKLYESRLKDLSGSKLNGYNLAGLVLSNADLRGAHLENADLRGAHLENARLWEARLENARLWEARLENADLWGARLENADLWGAHLENADLRGAKN
jgi:hypothetical protein